MKTTPSPLMLCACLFVSPSAFAASDWYVGLAAVDGRSDQTVQFQGNRQSGPLKDNGISLQLGKTGEDRREYFSVTSILHDDATVNTFAFGADSLYRDGMVGGYFGVLLGLSALTWDSDISFQGSETVPVSSESTSNFAYGVRVGGFVEFGDNWGLDVSYQLVHTNLKTQVEVTGQGTFNHTIDRIATLHAGVNFRF